MLRLIERYWYGPVWMLAGMLVLACPTCLMDSYFGKARYTLEPLPQAPCPSGEVVVPGDDAPPCPELD